LLSDDCLRSLRGLGQSRLKCPSWLQLKQPFGLDSERSFFGFGQSRPKWPSSSQLKQPFDLEEFPEPRVPPRPDDLSVLLLLLAVFSNFRIQ